MRFFPRRRIPEADTVVSAETEREEIHPRPSRMRVFMAQCPDLLTGLVGKNPVEGAGNCKFDVDASRFLNTPLLLIQSSSANDPAPKWKSVIGVSSISIPT